VAVHVLSSCKREERVLRVPPPAADTADAPPMTAFHAGASSRTATSRPTAPPPVDDEENAYASSEGRRLFEAMNCSGCHSHGGGGGIGPALTDNRWIHGWQPEVIFDTIVWGRPDGMPSFGGKLSDAQVWELVAYVRSLSGLTSKQAAPGRTDQMRAAPPPNSVATETPRSSTAELAELRRREELEFARRGWLDPRSGRVRIPDAIVREVTGSATRPAARPSTRAATQPTAMPTTRAAAAAEPDRAPHASPPRVMPPERISRTTTARAGAPGGQTQEATPCSN
jgi:cytochrome c oxidase cbb3-type subunit 3